VRVIPQFVLVATVGSQEEVLISRMHLVELALKVVLPGSIEEDESRE